MNPIRAWLGAFTLIAVVWGSQGSAATEWVCGAGDYQSTYAVTGAIRATALRSAIALCRARSRMPSVCAQATACKAIQTAKPRTITMIVPSHSSVHSPGASHSDEDSGSSSHEEPTPTPRDTSPTLCPDGNYHGGGGCNLCPDGKYHGGTDCNLGPDGNYHGGEPSLCPDGKYNSGGCTLCPDGDYHGGSDCDLGPDGKYHGNGGD